MSILIFLAILFVLILVHELGHFVAAKRMGMRVDEFGIGFPPRLFGVQRGETLYSLNAFPIGGFVKIYGEDGAAAEADTSQSRSFVSKSKWSQAAVLVAGVAMNALLAWLLFAGALMVGVERAVPEAEAGPNAVLTIAEVLPESPASRAGVPAGATVTGVGTDEEAIEPLHAPSAFSAYVEAHPRAFFLRYDYGGESRTVLLDPERGVIDGEAQREAVGMALALTEVVSRPIHSALYEGFILAVTGLRDITIAIATLLADALRFDADLSQVAGPVGIVSMVGEASALGFTTLLMFTGFISLNLAVINLLPFPALDGGRLLFVAIEAAKGSPIRPRVAHALNSLGFLLLILLMVAITWSDISRIF